MKSANKIKIVPCNPLFNCRQFEPFTVYICAWYYVQLGYISTAFWHITYSEKLEREQFMASNEKKKLNNVIPNRSL